MIKPDEENFDEALQGAFRAWTVSQVGSRGRTTAALLIPQVDGDLAKLLKNPSVHNVTSSVSFGAVELMIVEKSAHPAPRSLSLPPGRTTPPAHIADSARYALVHVVIHRAAKPL